ncbi:hypothetical protein TARUN_9532 [Trichoderma arundinaceum]|uniref:Uncharacterized protein n=1 Tax=Trichoderma arundinaceum TaxID=490622 RepID=A0A395N9P0_TRIAR|nr:hypothetical protein TARUN_9532 [Trichoderma arundinaceum]
MKSAFDPNLEEERMPSDAGLRSMILNTVTCFQPFIPSMRMESFQMGLQDVFSDAIKIHATMLKSKAIFVVWWTGEDNGETLCTYDPETMTPFQDDIDASSSDYAVQLIESPAVWKTGNTEGKNFGSAMMLVQSSVVLRQNEATEVPENRNAV